MELQNVQVLGETAPRDGVVYGTSEDAMNMAETKTSKRLSSKHWDRQAANCRELEEVLETTNYADFNTALPLRSARTDELHIDEIDKEAFTATVDRGIDVGFCGLQGNPENPLNVDIDSMNMLQLHEMVSNAGMTLIGCDSQSSIRARALEALIYLEAAFENFTEVRKRATYMGFTFLTGISPMVAFIFVTGVSSMWAGVHFIEYGPRSDSRSQLRCGDITGWFQR